jgi:ATP-dependent DNA helicase DinG
MAVETIPLMGITTSHVRDLFRPGGALEIASKASGRDWKHNPTQEEYAAQVWDTLNAQNPMGDVERTRIGLLEAATGAGKTLGYLIPLLLWHVTDGKRSRVGVSTYTKALQRQIYRDEIPLAVEVVRRVIGSRGWNPKVVIRVGLANFISRAKCERLLRIERDSDVPNDERILAVERILSWLDAIEDNQEDYGTFDEYAADAGSGADTPVPGISRDALALDYDEVYKDKYKADCLRGQRYDKTAPNDRPAWRYLRMTSRAREASVLIVNHALTIMHAVRWFHILDPDGDDAIRALVCDEAEHLPDMAALYTGTRISIHKLASHVDREPVLALKDALAKISRGETGEDGARRVPHMLLAPSDPFMVRTRRKIVRLVLDAVPEILECAGISGDEGARSRAYLRDTAMALEAWAWRASTSEERDSLVLRMDHDANDLRFVQHATAPGIEWSPVRGYPQLVLAPVEPGRILGRYWAPLREGEPRLHAAIFTSATMSDVSLAQLGQRQFALFMNDVGIHEHDPGKTQSAGCRIIRSNSIEPRRFGRMRFVIAADAPSPRARTREEKERIDALVAEAEIAGDGCAVSRLPAEYPAWMCRVLLAAAGLGGRVLVLCTSYADAESIGDACRDAFARKGLGVLVHARGERIEDASRPWRDQKRIETPVFLTPAAWSGVNWPGVIDHLVISKIPFFPPNEMMCDALSVAYRDRNIGADAERTLRAAGILRSRWKLRQGLGRPIRRYNDRVTVWLPDPGFPLPDWVSVAPARILRRIPESSRNAHRHVGMKRAVPARFMRDYDQADLIFASGRIQSPEYR